MNESLSLINDIPVNKCPYCYQKIEKVEFELKKANKCPVCKKDVKDLIVTDFDNEIKHLEEEKKELLDLINLRKEELTELNYLLDEKYIQKKEYERAIEEKKAEFFKDSNFKIKTNELNEKYKKISELNINLSQANRKTALINKIDEKNRKRADLNSRLEKNNEKLIQINKTSTPKLEEFFDIFKVYLENIGFKQIKTIVFNEKDNILRINGENIDEFSNSNQFRIHLSFYYALLKYSLINDCLYHRILFIDTINKQDIDEKDIKEIIKEFEVLAQSKQVQLLIFSTEFPSYLKSDSANKIFIENKILKRRIHGLMKYL